jgi:hypothetical protein
MHAGNGQLHQIDKSRQLQRKLSYTWRPKSVGSEGSTHSMAAYSGPMYCGGLGKK